MVLYIALHILHEFRMADDLLHVLFKLEYGRVRRLHIVMVARRVKRVFITNFVLAPGATWCYLFHLKFSGQSNTNPVTNHVDRRTYDVIDLMTSYIFGTLSTVLSGTSTLKMLRQLGQLRQ
jgi:hypothetical protein